MKAMISILQLMTQQGMNIKKKNLQQRLQTMNLMMGTKSVNPKEKTTWRYATLRKNIKTRWRSKVANINGTLLVFMTSNVHTFNGLFACPNIFSFLSFTCIGDLAWKISWSGEAPWVNKIYHSNGWLGSFMGEPKTFNTNLKPWRTRTPNLGI